MIAVVQRVSRAAVEVEKLAHRAVIGHGLCVLLGIEREDSDKDAKWMAGKIARLRVFRDADGKMNRSVQEVGGGVLLISQFTLAGDCRKGNRPSFVGAAEPGEGERLYELVATHLAQDQGLEVGKGVFGAMMAVELVNDGPVTLIVRS